MSSLLVASAPVPSTPVFATRGAVRNLLRLEGFALFALAVGLYFAVLRADGGLFAACFLVPDLALLGYLAGPRAGAIAYDAAHSSIGPLALGALGLFAVPGALPFALIWLAHVGFDRALGYGLKYATAFGHTHLGVVGRR